MLIILPDEIKLIIKKLKASNFDAYAVGGCVRDSILNRSPQDWDICTNATPEQTVSIFKDKFLVIPTGLKHGTVTIIINECHFEVTTYRIDGDYNDSRHPDSVSYTNNLLEDLSRRDFTINAMAYNEQKGIIDPFNGQKDLYNKLIVCVGNADNRIKEDYLRALRAIRFACQLEFDIDNSVIHSIIRNKSLIEKISMERIRDEFCKILLSERPAHGIVLLNKTGLLEYMIPELSTISKYEYIREPEGNKISHSIFSIIDNTPASLSVRLSAFLYCISEYIDGAKNNHNYKREYTANTKYNLESKELLRRLRFDKKTIETVSSILNELQYAEEYSDINIKKMIVRIGSNNLENFFSLKTSIAQSKENENKNFDKVASLKERCRGILSESHPLYIKDLKINGKDLISIGYKNGKKIGILLDELLELVLEHPEFNTREYLIKISENKLNDFYSRED